jgi:hypothetical protein
MAAPVVSEPCSPQRFSPPACSRRPRTTGGSPVRAAWDLIYTRPNDQTDGTWDPTALYYALYGTDKVYRRAGQGGRNLVTSDGLNFWARHGHHQRYLVLTDAARLSRSLDALIDAH